MSNLPVDLLLALSWLTRELFHEGADGGRIGGVPPDGFSLLLGGRGPERVG